MATDKASETESEAASETTDTTGTTGTTEKTDKAKGSTKAAKPPKPPKEPKVKKEKKARQPMSAHTAKIRVLLGRLIWMFFVICALFLAIGALLVALDANNRNGLVKFVLDGANVVDLGIFSRRNGIKDFGGDNAGIKNALFNWGLGAVAYLIVGRIIDRLVRP